MPLGVAASESALLQSRLHSLVRPAMGSAAFLAAVECSWQLHEQCAPPQLTTCLHLHCSGLSVSAFHNLRGALSALGSNVNDIHMQCFDTSLVGPEECHRIDTKPSMSASVRRRWSPILPKPLRLVTAPAVYGLQAVRTATWVAAVLMTAVGLRAGCFSMVDASLLAAQRCSLRS